MTTEYEVIIGMEVHAQLLTASKMFCPCSAQYAAAPPNTLVCPICLGMPGVLPTINTTAVEYTAMTGLALNGHVAPFSRFDRKNYPYPDLVKGYQISQYEYPIAQGGWLIIEVDGTPRRIGIRRVHLEEDTARLVHADAGEGYSLVDVNRSGMPLMEVVSEPDIRTPEEARLYLVKLRAILRYLGVCTGNMEEGAMRCEANVSVRPRGSTDFGTKVEVKNMNSFRAVYHALEYEIKRQIEVLESGGRVVQETRGWRDGAGITVSQRSKEYAHDYRYFPEPDLPPLVLSSEWVERIRARLPELPDAVRDRLMTTYGLSSYQANLLTISKATVDYFEAAVALHADARAVANWMTGELFRLLNATGAEIEDTRLTPEHLAEMLKMMDRGTISASTAKVVLEEMFQAGRHPAEVVRARGLTQISDAEQLEAQVEQVIAAHPQPVNDYLSGKKAALGFLVGQVMKATRGKANPAMVNELLAKKLEQIEARALAKGGNPN